MHNGSNPFGGRIIFRPAICTLPLPHIEISVETRVENERSGQRTCQVKNLFDVGQ